MPWSEGPGAFLGWCVSTVDVGAMREALKSVPDAAWSEVAARLQDALAQAGPDEATVEQRRQGIALSRRMTSPSGLLRRQIRLEKARLVAEETARRSGGSRPG